MIPIKAPPILDYGIAIYVPPLEQGGVVYVKCEISYVKDNPLFAWRNCDNNSRTLWTDVSAYSDTGILFLYKTLKSLDIGFYTIRLEARMKSGIPLTGSMTLGVTRDYKNKIIIGMPFSIYPPIPLS